MAGGETLRLKSPADGFELEAYRVRPSDARRGGLVVIQEIFGVTEHIKEVCEGFAAEGYESIAPALFERSERGFQAAYADAGEVQKGRAYSEAAQWDVVAADIQAALDQLQPPRYVVGYCWGGTAAWVAACRCDGLAAASAYYGRRIPELIDETPRCPIILHFGKSDPTIPIETVEAIRQRHPDIPVYLYDAGHGFNSDRRRDYHEDSARLARLRTLQLFQRAGGSRGEV